MHKDPAIIWGTRRISWGQLEQYCQTAISHLKGIGIKEGDRVAICAPTSPEYVIVLFALWRMKAVACPVSVRWPSLSVSDYLSRLHVALLLTTVSIKATFQTVPVRTLHLNEVVGFDARKDFYEVGDAWVPDPSQEATILATSGSSGIPKAAVHTWGNHHFNAQGSQSVISLISTDRWLLSLPLYHISGIAIVIRSFLAKAAVVIPTEDDLSETLTKRQVTHVSLVPTQLIRLLETAEGIAALKNLKCILLGGSAIPQTLMDRTQELDLPVYVSYGLTEMASQVATGRAGCVKLLPYRQLMISNEGEVLVRGETLFKGYVQSGRIHLPLENGWFKTGDMGRLENEVLTITGRRDNMFISGGENIHPEEIEKVLLLLEGVLEALVVPRSDKEFGQRPVGFIKYSNQPLSADVLKAHCAKHLPKFKVPIECYPWPEDLINKGIKISRQDFIQRI